MNNGDILSLAYNIQHRWMKFKRGRNKRPTEFSDKDKEWLTIKQREEMIDTLIQLIQNLNL